MSMTTALPSKLSGKLTPEELAVWGGRWYHNFSPLGLPAGKQTEVQLQHQLEKQGDIFRHVRDAFLRLKKDPKGLQLTSTDGLSPSDWPAAILRQVCAHRGQGAVWRRAYEEPRARCSAAA